MTYDNDDNIVIFLGRRRYFLLIPFVFFSVAISKNDHKLLFRVYNYPNRKWLF